jgi:flagellar protein FlbD
MIELTKLNNEKYYMNPDLIEIIEITPDTLITMTNGKTHFALETPDEVIAKIEAYRIKLLQNIKVLRKRIIESDT